jgi:hypothetical protein
MNHALDLILVVVTNWSMRDHYLRVTIGPPHGYKLLCTWKFHQVFKYKSMFTSYALYIHVQIKSCHALDLVLLVVTNRSMRYERRLSRVYKLLWAWKFREVFKYKSMFALYASHVDLVLLVVTNRSMRDVYLESRFGLHVDTNYCAHVSFHLVSHIWLACISFIWNMMLKLLFVLPQLHHS